MNIGKQVNLVILFLVVSIVYFLYAGWVLSDLWNWFIAPFGIAEITKAHAIGILITVSIMKGVGYIPKEKDNQSVVYASLFAPIFSWLIGYFVINHIGI